MAGAQRRSMKIGLALGSGAARGWAHIGVIKALRELGIEPDVVAGTSIGAIVGAYYAAGRIDGFHDWVQQLGRREIMGLADITVGSGLVDGQKLRNLYARHLDDTTIENLAIPFAAVATEVENGTEVWLQEGPIADALRASSAVPGLFSPVLMGGRWLADGGLVNPVPVSVCRALGAERIIAVNLNGDLLGRHARQPHDHPKSPRQRGPSGWITYLPDGVKERTASLIKQWLPVATTAKRGGPEADPDRPGILDVAASAINVMQDRITRSRMAGDPPDVIITPRLAHLGLLEFDRGQEAIAKGYDATMEFQASLKSLEPTRR